MVRQGGGHRSRFTLRARGTVGIAALATTLIAAQLATSATAATTSRTSARVAASTAFVPGTATATSQAFALAPRDAGLAATVTVGRSVAVYTNDLTQASSQALDLGLIGSTLAVQCSALPAPLKAGQLPKPITAESDRGAASSNRTVAGPDSQSASAASGREFVSANPAPHENATATFDGERLSIPGLIALNGLSSSSYAQLIPGKARIAKASADIAGLTLAGQIQIDDLHWQASVRSGTKPSRSASFSVGSLKIAGTTIPIPNASLGGALGAVNKALTSTGLHINLPTLTDTDGVIAMTPLSVGIATSAIGAKLLNPVIALIFGQVGGSVVDAAAKAVCTVGSLYGLVNLFVAALDGVGAFDVNLGGATATTDDTTYGNPFGNGGNGPPSLGGGSSSGAAPPATGGGNGATIPPLPAESGAPLPVSSPQVAGTRTVASSCSSTSPAGRPGCSRGAGLAVGLIALATLGGVAGADYFVVRRRRRLTRMAIET